MLSHRLPVTPIGVVVADQDVLACKLLANRLRKHKIFRVTECFENTTGTVNLIKKLRPSVALLSSSLPGDILGGFAVVREMGAASPVRSVLLLDTIDRRSTVEAFRVGAKGVFSRSAFQFEALCKCVHKVHQGQVWADSKQLGWVLDEFSQSTAVPVQNPQALRSISARERDVVQLLVAGRSNREIAESLHLSQHTIKNYVFRVFEKLGVSSRVELVHYVLGCRDELTVPRKPEVPITILTG